MTWTGQFLIDVPMVERFERLPKHLQFVVTSAKDLLVLETIWLFGSRARGDARANSDFDLVFKINSDDNWNEFLGLVDEKAPTLYRYELVKWHDANLDLRASVLKEGIVLYDQQN